MAGIPSVNYLVIPLCGKSELEGIGIRCTTVDQAEMLAMALGYKRYKIIQEVELVSIVRDKAIGKKDE